MGGAPNYGDYTGTFFDQGSSDYDPGNIVGATCLGTGGQQEGEGVMSALWSGGGDMRGKVEGAMKAADPGQLTARAEQWWKASEALQSHSQKMRAIRAKLSGAWEGEDADAAMKVLDGHSATLYARCMDTAKITGTLRTTASQLQWCKDKWGHDASTLGGFGNWVSGNEDREAADDYNAAVGNVVKSMNSDMPQSVPSQVKGGPAPYSPQMNPDAPTPGAPGGGPNVGSSGPGAHGNVPMPGVSDPGNLPDGHQPGFEPGNDPQPPVISDPPPPVDPNPPIDNNPPITTTPPIHVGAPGSDLPGSSVPTVDSGTSLAGYDGGVGAGGIGGIGGGGAYGAGGGAPGIGGGPGALGAGAGGYGATGTAGLGAGAAGPGAGGGGVLVGGGAATGAGAGGAGARGAGMMPMRGGGRGGDEDERERSTWLEEDEDVWGGGSDAPPGVISD